MPNAANAHRSKHFKWAIVGTVGCIALVLAGTWAYSRLVGSISVSAMPDADAHALSTLFDLRFERAAAVRPVCTIDGYFTRDSELSVELWQISDGETALIQTLECTRSSKLSRPDDGYLVKRQIDVVLANVQVSSRSVPAMASRGLRESVTFSEHVSLTDDFIPSQTRVFAGEYNKAAWSVVYVESDSKSHALEPDILADPAKFTNGRYRVVRIRAIE